MFNFFRSLIKKPNYPENIEEIRKFAKKIDLDVKYLLGEKLDRCLWIYTDYIPSNVILNIGESLMADSLQSIPTGVVIQVGNYIFLRSVNNISGNIVISSRVTFLTQVRSITNRVQFNCDVLKLDSVDIIDSSVELNVNTLLIPRSKKVKII